MPIQLSALNRHLKAAIAHFPVRWQWRKEDDETIILGGDDAPKIGSWSSLNEALQALDTGTIDTGTGMLVVAKDAFPNYPAADSLPESEDFLWVMQDAGWAQYRIESITGTEDPNCMQIKFELIPPGQ